MALDFQRLTDEIARDNEINASAATLLARLADEIERSNGDQAALDELVARLRANQDTLAAAVAASTPEEVDSVPPVVEPGEPSSQEQENRERAARAREEAEKQRLNEGGQ